MFILNLKINKRVFTRWFIIILIIFGALILCLTAKKVYLEVNSRGVENNNLVDNCNSTDLKNNSISNSKNEKNFISKSETNQNVNSNTSLKFETNGIIEIGTNNFTNFLESCNENIDDFVGKTIHISGFVYRLKSFSENQFVIARLMPIQYKSASASPICNFSNNQSKSDNNIKCFSKQKKLKFSIQNTTNTNQLSKPHLKQISAFDENTVVVGILCEGSTLSNFQSNTWVDLTGTIQSTNYQEKGQIPFIQVTSIQSIKENPQELFVSIPNT